MSRLLWHSTMDLLTVRYFQVIGGASEKLRDLNAGPAHSFLKKDELKSPTRVLEAYHARLPEAAHAVLEAKLNRP
jgi:hypothetical protein